MTQGEQTTLGELLDDPIIDILLHGDGLSRADLVAAIEDARHKLHPDPAPPADPTRID